MDCNPKLASAMADALKRKPDRLYLVPSRRKNSVSVAAYGPTDADMVVTERRFVGDVVRDALAATSRVHRSRGDQVDCCSICHDEFAIRETCRTLGCNHTFHRRCVDEWCRESGGVSCPVCREDHLKGFGVRVPGSPDKQPLARLTAVRSNSDVARFLDTDWLSSS